MSEEFDDDEDEDCCWEPDDQDRENATILLEHAQITGKERSDLEEVLEFEELDRLDRERLQELVNSHISTLHAHQ